MDGIFFFFIFFFKLSDPQLRKQAMRPIMGFFSFFQATNRQIIKTKLSEHVA